MASAEARRRRKSGRSNAYGRLDWLVDPGSFIETGLLGSSSLRVDEAQTPREGKICGFAKIDVRDVAVCVNDLTVKGASTGADVLGRRCRPAASHVGRWPLVLESRSCRAW